MYEIMQKWGLIAESLIITLVLVAIRYFLDLAQLDFIVLNNLITAFIGGAIFTVAIIFTGTLTDYKESEKIPGELATSLLALYQDARLLRPSENPHAAAIRDNIRMLHRTIIRNIQENIHSPGEIRSIIEEINADIFLIADQNAPPQYIMRLRGELTTIDRLMTRIRTIATTSFVPAAYAIAELAVTGVVIILFFIKLDPYYEGIIIFTVLVALLISLVRLIKDMDNPFEFGKRSYADVDFSPLLELEEYFDGTVPRKE